MPILSGPVPGRCPCLPMSSDLDADVAESGRPEEGSPVTGRVRALRTLALGGTSLALASAAHTAGGGRLPAAGVLVVAGILLGLMAVTVTARRCRTGLLIGLLTVQQVALHVVFEAASMVGARCGAIHGTAGHHTSELGPGAAACSAAPAVIDAISVPGWAMWAGHLVATVLTAILLARAEAWLWRAAERIIASATATPGERPSRAWFPLLRSQSAPVVLGRAYSLAGPRGPPLLFDVS